MTQQTYWGIFRNVTLDAHQHAIDAVIRGALENAQLTDAQLGTIAAAIESGLDVCLCVGYLAFQI